MDAHVERGLVNACQRGDGRAFELLLAPHRAQAYRLAFRLTGNHEEAEDVLQEALLKAFRGLPDFDHRATFGTWLWQVVLGAAIDRKRQAHRHPPAAGFVAAEPAAMGERSDPVRRLEMSELQRALQEGLAKLPDEQRAALVLVAFEQMSYAEAAAVLHCPEGTLAWRIAEGRRRLSDELRPYLATFGESSHEV